MGNKEKDHNEGQEAGAKADFLDELLHLIDPFHSEHYDRGFRHGVDSKTEKDPLSEFLFSSGEPKTEERREEPVSNVTQDEDDDDDLFLQYYMEEEEPLSESEPEPEPEPKVEPIVKLSYSKRGSQISITEMTYSFASEEEKAKHFRQMALIEEMLGEKFSEEDEGQDQEKLDGIIKKVESDSVWDNLMGIASMYFLKDKE